MKCEAGCMRFDGGETKHTRGCAYYPESLTKAWHDTEAKLQDEIENLRCLLADKDYIRIKAAHNAGQLSWFNMVNEREARAGYTPDKER